jgi:hypothetical protein
LRAGALQVPEYSESAAAQVGEAQRFLGAFAFEVSDRPVTAAAVLEHLGERLILDH